MITKYILNEKEKKKCDALPVEKKEAILKEIENIEKNYHIQLERIRILKGYFSVVNENEKDVYGKGIQNRYKYGDNHRRKYKERIQNE